MCCTDEDVCKDNCKFLLDFWILFINPILNPKGTDSLFGLLAFSDTTTGIILLALSIFVLCSCLIFLVKVLNSMLT